MKSRFVLNGSGPIEIDGRGVGSRRIDCYILFENGSKYPTDFYVFWNKEEGWKASPWKASQG